MPLDLTKPVQTRDGRKARIICTDDAPILAVVVEPDGVEHPATYQPDGLFLRLSESAWDLINVPERLQGWVNLYRYHGDGFYPGDPYPTREAADAAATDRIGVAYIDTERLA